MQHFGAILNYLRDGECELPTDARGRKELLREAEHYEVSSSSLFSCMSADAVHDRQLRSAPLQVACSPDPDSPDSLLRCH